MEKLDSLSYTAGIIEGEGCIQITKERNKQYQKDYYRVRVYVDNSNPLMPIFLHEKYGGYLGSWEQKNKKWRRVFRWRAEIKDTKSFLLKMKDYVTCKRDEVDTALSFFDAKNVTEKEALYQRMKFLKSPEYCASIYQKIMEKGGEKE